MSEKQIWQVEGLGTDRGTLETVLHIFASDGVQGKESQRALIGYIGKLSDDSLRDMIAIDEETALQLFVDCFGAHMTFDKVMKMLGYVTTASVQRMGWISPKAYAEVVGKYDERTKRLEDERDALLSKCSDAVQRMEIAEKQRAELQNTLAHYKADLYDFYAREGKLPNYERR